MVYKISTYKLSPLVRLRPIHLLIAITTFPFPLPEFLYGIRRFFPFTTGMRHRSTESKSREAFNIAMSSLVAEFGESMPHQVAYHPNTQGNKRTKISRPLIFLHCGIFANKEAVFQDMLRQNIVSTSTTSGTLRRWWNEEHWNVKIKSWQPFAKCDDCVKFRAKLLTTTFGPALDDLRQLQQMHRNIISIGRSRYDIREKVSKCCSDMFLHVSIDAMDNKKTNVPQTRHLSHTKKSAGGEVLKTRIMGKNKRKLSIILSALNANSDYSYASC